MDHQLAKEKLRAAKEKIRRAALDYRVNTKIGEHGHIFETVETVISDFYVDEYRPDGTQFSGYISSALKKGGNETHKLGQLDKVIDTILNDIEVKEKPNSNSTNENQYESFIKRIAELEAENESLTRANISFGKILTDHHQVNENLKRINSDLLIKLSRVNSDKFLIGLKISIFVFFSYALITSYKIFNIPFNAGIFTSIQLALSILLVLSLVKKLPERSI